MPVISRPKDAPSLFGGSAQVVIGGGLAQQLRAWQDKKRQVTPRPDGDESSRSE